MPGAKPKDGKILRDGLRYADNAIKDADKFYAGIGVGPGQHLPDVDGKPSLDLKAGGVIIPIHATNMDNRVRVRDFNKVSHPKKYVDFATFKEVAPGIIKAMQCDEERTMYCEAWTGDIMEEDGTFQVIQSGFFRHGSIAFIGGTVVVDASAKKTRSKKVTPTDAGDSEAIRESSAEMVSERSGRVVGGVALWNARLWRIRYSTKDSEAILVRQLDKFYLVMVEKDKLVYRDVPAEKYAPRYERLAASQLLAA
ncbi:MAG: hypothetical protein JWO50_213 [Candidatus Kaiserbacteria bacterium]|nr:hypothetical protein [Candidatus Kaiserbacteria bacterium]